MNMLEAPVSAELPLPGGGDAAAPAKPSYPCSLAQKRFWVMDQLQPGNPSLHVAIRWQIEGAITTPMLEHALRVIIQRHEILRSSFEEADGELMQTVEPVFSIRVPEIDLSALAAAESAAQAQRIAELEARASFDLRSKPPFVRVTRLRLRDQISVLLITAHHIVLDGWSVSLLAREFLEICAAQIERRPPRLPALPASYGEYSAWQAACGACPEHEASYWSKSLQGMRHFELVADHPRPAIQTSNSAVEALPLEPALTDALHNLGQRHHCTLFTTALTAFLSLLHRYTGECDIGVGTQVSVRDDVELEPLLGLFINTLVLRNDLSGDPSFETLLERVRDRVAEALEHRHMPLENIINLLRPQRDLSRNALFSINFLIQKSVGSLSAGPLKLSELPPISSGAIYDINLFLHESGEGWKAVCEYNTDLFEAGTIRQLLRCYEALLLGAVEDPGRNISKLPLLTPADREALLVKWNDTAVDYPRQHTVVDLVEAQAARTPDAEAVYCGGRRLRYRELDESANRLAHELQARGVRPGHMVGVLLERSTDLAMALLAIVKAGAAYVPIDPAHPADRISYVAGNCKLAALVTRSSLEQRLGAAVVDKVLLDREAASIARRPATAPIARASASDPAYVIYTSGSTGRPKGVIVHHQALANLIHAIRKSPGLEAGETLVSPSTIAFDIGALEVFLPLSVGARLVIATESEVFDGAELGRLLGEQRARMMFSTPVGWQLLLAGGWRGTPGLKMLSGGEALSRQLADALLPCGEELWNVYGPTETTVFACILRVQPGQGPVHLGPPLPNYRFYVLDGQLQPVAPGAPGELYIGGDGVGLGYVDLPELTRARFIADPFCQEPGARLYRSGDIVRLRQHGELEYLGRADNQIKLRGFRIELSEIESVLLSQPGVKEAVVVAGRDGAGDGAIWAYVVCPPAAGDSTETMIATLRRGLLKSLPRYMCPAAIIPVDELPKLPTGKIDRRSLPTPASAAETPVAASSALATETERRLARIWAEILGVKEIASHENFFELGGHSLLAARALARIHKEFDKRVTLSALFGAPTLKQFARLLEQDSAREYDFRQVVKLQPNGSRPPIIAINNTGIYYLLSKHLGPEQPFTSLQLFDPSLPEKNLPASFEEIAAAYVQLIRRIQPEGPYALLGWCMAGALAFEVARQLQQQRQHVSHLILVDTYTPGYIKRLSPVRAWLAEYSYRWQLIAADWARVRAGRQGVKDFLYNRVIVKKLLGYLGLTPVQQSCEADPLSSENYDGWLLAYLQDAASRYAPGRYAGKVHLLRSAEEPSGRFLDLRMGWSEFARDGVDVTIVDGDHFSMFREPGVGKMARAIAAIMGQK